MTSIWKVDPWHSAVLFKVDHLTIGEITGFLGAFNLEVETEGSDFGEVTRVLFSANPKTINTNNKQRDKQLLYPQFFDVEKYSHVTFNGTKFEKQRSEPVSVYRKDYMLYGNLTINAVTKPVTLKGEFGGMVTDTFGQKKAGFTVRGEIYRKEFGLTWDELTDEGKTILGNLVRIQGNIQLIKQDDEINRSK